VKVFITGLYGSGKSTTAKTKFTDLLYVDFDSTYDYSRLYVPDIDSEFLDKLPSDFVTDAIPPSLIPNFNYDRFLQYARNNKVKIICVICTNKEEWIKRACIEKRKIPRYKAFVDYYKFYFNLLTLLSPYGLQYIDTYDNTQITLEELYRRINWIKPLSDYI
jgi:hypothetical protein